MLNNVFMVHYTVYYEQHIVLFECGYIIKLPTVEQKAFMLTKSCFVHFSQCIQQASTLTRFNDNEISFS